MKSPSNNGVNETQFEDENQALYNERFRFLIVDCRLAVIQKESLLPKSIEFEIPSKCDKEDL